MRRALVSVRKEVRMTGDQEIVKSEEEHIDWLEAQLHQVKEIGLENYLAQQVFE
jgi:bacterioferritin (cytochrome b1)